MSSKSKEYELLFSGSESMWNSSSRVRDGHNSTEIRAFTSDVLDMVHGDDFEMSTAGGNFSDKKRFMDDNGDIYVRPTVDDIDSDDDTSYRDVYSATQEESVNHHNNNHHSSGWTEDDADQDELSFLHDKYVVRSRAGLAERDDEAMSGPADKMAAEVMTGIINSDLALKQSRNSRCLCTNSRDGLSLLSIAFVLIGLVVLQPGLYLRARAPPLYLPLHAVNMCSRTASDGGLLWHASNTDCTKVSTGGQYIIPLNDSLLESHVDYVPFVLLPVGTTAHITLTVQQAVSNEHSHNNNDQKSENSMRRKLMQHVKSQPVDMRTTATGLVNMVKRRTSKELTETKLLSKPQGSLSRTVAVLHSSSVYVDTQDYDGYTVDNDYHSKHAHSDKYVLNLNQVGSQSSLLVSSESWKPTLRKKDDTDTLKSYASAAQSDCSSMCLAELTQPMHEVVLHRAMFSTAHETCSIQHDVLTKPQPIDSVLLLVSVELKTHQTAMNKHLIRQQPPLFVGFHQATLSPDQHRGVAHIVQGTLLVIIGLSVAYIRPTLKGDQRGI